MLARIGVSGALFLTEGPLDGAECSSSSYKGAQRLKIVTLNALCFDH